MESGYFCEVDSKINVSPPLFGQKKSGKCMLFTCTMLEHYYRASNNYRVSNLRVGHDLSPGRVNKHEVRFTHEW